MRIQNPKAKVKGVIYFYNKFYLRCSTDSEYAYVFDQEKDSCT